MAKWVPVCQDYGPDTADLVDSEVKELVARKRVSQSETDLVSINIDVLHQVADVLMEERKYRRR